MQLTLDGLSHFLVLVVVDGLGGIRVLVGAIHSGFFV
jgi:hypothetical protein